MYREHIIVFIDILGFGELVETKDSSDVDRCIQIFNEDLRATEEDDTYLERRTTYFSDTIVTSIPIRKKDGSPQIHGMLYHELVDLALSQANLIWKLGVFLRGSITVGELYHDEDKIFGPGLIRAYKLENKAAFPRVVIDEKLLRRYFSNRELLNPIHATHKIDFKYSYPMMFKEANKVRSLDYMNTVFVQLEPDSVISFCKTQRDLILQGLRNANTSVVAKYLWLAKYHNRTLDKWGSEKSYASDSSLYVR